MGSDHCSTSHAARGCSTHRNNSMPLLQSPPQKTRHGFFSHFLPCIPSITHLLRMAFRRAPLAMLAFLSASHSSTPGPLKLALENQGTLQNSVEACSLRSGNRLLQTGNY